MAQNLALRAKKSGEATGPCAPAWNLSDYKDAVNTNPVTSVYAALGKLKAQLPELTWGEVKELQLTTQCYAFARVLDGEAMRRRAEQRRQPGPAGVPAAGGSIRRERPAGRHRGGPARS